MATNRVKVLYIGGYGRSGSTLLVRLLGRLPGFQAVGEMWNIWQKSFTENELCGCGQPFQSCEFWSAVVEEAFGGFGNVDLEEIKQIRQSMQSHAYLPLLAYPQLRNAAQREKIAHYQSALQKLYSAIQSVSGCRVIIDSSKGPRYAMLLNEIPEIDLRVVHLTRDSRAVVYSWQKKMVKPEVYWKTEYMDRPSPISAALNWNITNMLTQRFGKREAGYRFVRYEDLIEAPDTWLNEIVNFAGEDVGEAVSLEREGEVDLSVDHTAVGNPNRFRKGPIELRRDDEWRTKMSPAQKNLVTALTLPLLNKYGYLNNQPSNLETQLAHAPGQTINGQSMTGVQQR